MDELTIKYYSNEAKNISNKYNSISSGIHEFFPVVFTKGMKILDIGCGSGRDMAYLLKQGCDVYGIDASPEMISCAIESYPELNGRVKKGILPNSGNPFNIEFDGVLCSAVLMHLPKEELFDSAFAIKNILKDDGKLLISIPCDRPDLDETYRDKNGRLYNSVKPEYLQLLFERLGFSIINKWKTKDTFRPDYTWYTIAFNLKHKSALRPIDQVESILSKDRKTATYKLALIRALSEIAIAEYNTVRWLSDGMVGIPLLLLAEKWLYYYWPVFESSIFIPQIRGESINCKNPIAFRSLFMELIEEYKKKGGLTQFVVDYRSKKLSKRSNELVKTLLEKIGITIIKGPVTYAAGGKLFKYKGDTKEIIIDSEIWIELSINGYWIRDAVLLRWAELTSEMSKKEIKPSYIIDLLLTLPIEEREVEDARAVYSSLPSKECTWTGNALKQNFDIDHIIPFSLWHNNDLWNLVPVLRSVNNQKRDKLPTQSILLNRKDCLLYYWDILRKSYPFRFDNEMTKIIGVASLPSNWHYILFKNVSEAIEITAIHKGCERWP